MWVLILFMYGTLVTAEAPASLAGIHGFKTEELCLDAGVQAVKLTVGTMKGIKYVCVKQKD